jgi:hypothetical protein
MSIITTRCGKMHNDLCAIIDGLDGLLNNDRYQWDLARLSPKADRVKQADKTKEADEVNKAS